jgi:hypothetical protein
MASTPSRITVDALEEIRTTGSGGAGTNVNISGINGSAPALSNPLPVELSDGTNPFGTVANPLHVTDPSVGLTGVAAPTSATEVGIVDSTGKLQNLSAKVLTNANAASVAIVDANGNQITSFGGGTQYADGTTQATPTGTIALGKNPSNVVHALALDAAGNLLVDIAAGGSGAPTPIGSSPTSGSLSLALTSAGVAQALQVDAQNSLKVAIQNQNPVEIILEDPETGSPARIDDDGNLFVNADININKNPPTVANPIPVEFSDGLNPFGTATNPVSVKEIIAGSPVSAANPFPVLATITSNQPALVQATLSGAGTTQAFGSANTAGNLLIVWARIGAAPAVTDTLGNVWTSISGYGNRLWYVAGCKSGPNTVNFGGGGGLNQAVIAEFANVAIGVVPEVIGAIASGTGTLATTSTITTLSQNDLVLVGIENETTNSAGYTYNNGFSATTTPSGNANLAWQVGAAIGTYNCTVTVNSSVSWVVGILAFKGFATLPVNQGIPAPNPVLSWYVSPQLNTDATQDNLVGQRTPNIFKTAQALSAGSTPVWTPTSGKKFRFMRYQIQMTDNIAQSNGGVVTLTFFDAATSLSISQDFYIPAAPSSGSQYNSPWCDLGNGILSAVANNALNANLSSAIVQGNFRINVCGTEE